MELKNIKPIFIIGAGHSGTSILYRMLAAHPDFAWFSQYSCRGGEIPGRFQLPFYKYFNRILRSVFLHDWSKEEKGLKIIPRPGDAEQIWNYIFFEDKNIPEEEIIHRIRKVLEAECTNWHKGFILVKNIRLRRYLPLLERAWPEAKFIHIIRDGRAIALSRKYKKSKEGGDRSKEDIENFFPRVKGWAEAIEIIDREKKNLDFFELKYEDFCSDVRGYLKKILNYVGLEETRFPLDRFSATLTSMNSKWFEAANPAEVAKIENIQKEMLKKYGYI